VALPVVVSRVSLTASKRCAVDPATAAGRRRYHRECGGGDYGDDADRDGRGRNARGAARVARAGVSTDDAVTLVAIAPDSTSSFSASRSLRRSLPSGTDALDSLTRLRFTIRAKSRGSAAFRSLTGPAYL
jgi:hypothetical protein